MLDDTTLAERPILFSGPMVRAILEGRKTQTRRVIKPQPTTDDGLVLVGRGGAEREFWDDKGISFNEGHDRYCPYGQPGDRLWVRETFRLRADQDHKPPTQDWWKSGAWYEADGNCEPSGCAGGAGKKRSSIHMPRWASRITLELTDVRVQRVQKISDEDIESEGMSFNELAQAFQPSMPREHFQVLWDLLNAKRGFGWDTNPWVWALTFRRVTP